MWTCCTNTTPDFELEERGIQFLCFRCSHTDLCNGAAPVLSPILPITLPLLLALLAPFLPSSWSTLELDAHILLGGCGGLSSLLEFPETVDCSKSWEKMKKWKWGEASLATHVKWYRSAFNHSPLFSSICLTLNSWGLSINPDVLSPTLCRCVKRRVRRKPYSEHRRRGDRSF